MKNENLLSRIRDELNDRKGQWQVISASADVPYFTLSKIANGTTKNPRWQTVEKLADHLEVA